MAHSIPLHFVVKAACLVIFCVLSATVPVAAQERPASVRVTVSDSTGAILVGATVELTEEGAEATVKVTDAQGRATFDTRSGRRSLRVTSPGFEDYAHPALILKPGENRVDVSLQLAHFEDTVVVMRDPSEAASDLQGDTLTLTLGAEELEALPDRPEELEAMLLELAGPGGELTVDGFRDGALPSKEQIQEIRIRRAMFSADNHNRGGTNISIVTRPGTDRWQSSVGYGFTDDALNARNAFASGETPEQHNRLDIGVDGPLVKGRTSLSLQAEAESSYESRTIRALGLSGFISSIIRQPQKELSVSGRIHHALSRTQSVRVEYRHESGEQENLGVGDFDLPERAYSSTNTENRLRFSSSGSFGTNLLNDLRLQVAWLDAGNLVVLDEGTIRVLDTVTRGGANIRGGRSQRAIEFNDKLDFRWRSHAISVGTQLDWSDYRSDEIRNPNGTFTFSTLPDVDAGLPLTFTQRRGDPTVAYSMLLGAWYVQDDVRLHKSFTMGFGLRHEWQSHLDEIWNLAPRFGFSWSPGSGGRTAVRGGIGIFHDWYDGSTYEETVQVDGTKVQDLTIESPGFPDPLSGGDLVLLPFGRVQQASHLQMPSIRQATLAIERRIGAVRVNGGYTIRDGYNLLRGRDVNAPRADGSRPDPEVGNIVEIQSIGRERAHDVSVGLNGRLPWRRIFLTGRYRWLHVRNDGDGPLSLPATNIAPDEWGPAGNDVNHSISGMASFDLMSDVQVGLNVRADSAPPYNITTGNDENGDTVFNDRPAGVGRNDGRGDGMFRMDLRLSWRTGVGRASSPQQGGGPRGGGGGRDWRADHRMMTEFYVRASNILNTVNPRGFSGVRSSPFFGMATSAQPARRIEIGTRIRF